jgi:hypothetical protein
MSYHLSERGRTVSDQDFTKLSSILVPFAQEMLGKHNEFYPFAATMDKAGNVAQVAGDIGSERTNSSELVDFLKQALGAQAAQGMIRASGICYNVGARLPGYADNVDAICCQLEHAAASPVQFFVPYRKGLFGRMKYDKPVVLPGQPSVFKRSNGSR